jgi:hypothetical protein
MKLFFLLAILLLIGLSIFADYQWKKWVAARQREREADENHRGRQN